jgi:hypothetical protein
MYARRRTKIETNTKRGRAILEKRIIKEEEEKVQRLVSEGSREIMGGEMSSYRLKGGR